MATETKNFHSFTAKDAKGEAVNMGNYKGKVVVIVNVASKCGFTPQYKGLEELYQMYKERNVVILGFPCNQFGSQEPGTEKEIVDFCTNTYQVTFPIMSKVDVNGKHEDPLYCWLKAEKKSMGLKRIKWNFEKFLVDQEGNCVQRYSSVTKPESLAADVEKLL